MADGYTSEVVESDQAVSVTEEGGLLCGPCQEDGHQLPADGYCVTCEEHLCQPCFNFHTKPKPMRKHILQNKNEMPSTKADSVSQKAVTHKCPLHENEPVTSYCTSHDRLCCEKCVAVGHQACKDVQSIDKISANMRGNKDFQGFLESLVFLKKRNETNKAKAVLNAERIESCYNRCIDDFSATLCKIKDKDKSKNRAVQSSTDHVLQQVTSWQADIGRHEKNKDDNSLFILMKTARKDVELMAANSDHVEKENTIEAYAFLPCDEPALIGKVVRPPYKIKQINVKHSSESTTCGVRGFAVLGNGKLLISDLNNRSIKLVNTEQDSIETIVKLNDYPRELTSTDDGEVYATQPNAKKILHFPSPIDKLNDYKELSVENQAWSIQHHEKTLTVDLRSNPDKIVDLGLDGKVKRTLISDCGQLKTDGGKQILTNPRHSVYVPNSNSVVFSDCSNDSVVEIQNDGKSRLIVQSEDLKSPYGIVLNFEGSYIVCSFTGNRVLRVSDSGEISDFITDIPNPVALGLDQDRHVLYIGGNGDMIHVYQL